MGLGLGLGLGLVGCGLGLGLGLVGCGLGLVGLWPRNIPDIDIFFCAQEFSNVIFFVACFCSKEIISSTGSPDMLKN